MEGGAELRQDGKSETRVTRIARALGELSLKHEDGDFLGAEGELLVRLGVSRPTLRQAAKIAETDRLISVRRGIKGGIYAARPDAADAIRTLTRFLRLKGATPQDLMVVGYAVSEEAAGLAARCADTGMRARLEAFANAISSHESPGAVFRAEMELGRLIAEMSGNPAISLVSAIGQSFGAEEHGISLFRDPADRAEARALQAELCQAILKGDGEIARLLMRRRWTTMTRWLEKAQMAEGREGNHGTENRA